METINYREVPLGGLRAMNVRRTLPSRERSLVGAWCFLDHYGPDDLSVREAMVVPPHPHTGLATVSWLFSGEIDHHDSAGNRARVRPGELNLMTAGRGISHSEYSTDDTEILHGCQLWFALPNWARQMDAGFESYVPPVMRGEGWAARVFLGSLLGSTSPVWTPTPLIGAELRLIAGARLDVAVEARNEHAVLVDTGAVTLNGEGIPAWALGYEATGQTNLSLEATEDSRVIVLGGPPFGEEIIMWWNFVARTNEEVVAYREEWERLLSEGDNDRFTLPVDDKLEALHAPPLPGVRLKPRR